MNKYLYCVYIGCIAVTCSCHSGRKAAGRSAVKNAPDFIDAIPIGKSSKHIHMRVIDGTRETPEPSLFVPYKKDVHNLRDKYAGVLNVPEKAINNLLLYEFIDEWYGVAYRLGGHDKTGTDCSGFSTNLYDVVYGISLPRTSNEQYNSCRRIVHPDEMKEGDLVFFGTPSRIHHVGIYLMNRYFVHASTSEGVTISSLEDPYWKRNFAGAGEMK